MKLIIEIDVDGAAFDDDRCNVETHRILNELAGNIITHGLTSNYEYHIRDINGNSCGYAKTIKE